MIVLVQGGAVFSTWTPDRGVRTSSSSPRGFWEIYGNKLAIKLSVKALILYFPAALPLSVALSPDIRFFKNMLQI